MKATKRSAMALVAACGAAISASVTSAQTATMPPHATNFSGNTRGYWFTAPTDFRITGVRALQDPATSNQFMNWAVVRFDGNNPPPVFSAVTNAFVQLGTGFNQPSGVFAPTSIDIHTGEVIGIYGNVMAASGATTGINSYTATLTPAVTSIFGSSVTLNRSGMQFHLGSATSPQGMHDLWSEPTSTAVTRTEFTYESLGPSGACCKPDGTCIVTSASFCTGSLGGTYQGDGIACATVSCPQPPSGACCFSIGSCTDLSTFACTAQGGVWQGAGNPCATVTCPQPPVITPTLCQTVTVSGSLGAGQVKWYQITVPAIASPSYLDIDTEGSTLAPANNTEIGLYTAAGALEDTDDDDGSDLLSQLSYGNTSSRVPFGNSVAYNGRDGSLAAGTYYLAVAGFNSVFATTGFGVTSPSTNTGSYQVRVRMCDNVPTGACCKPDGTCVEGLTAFTCTQSNGGIYQGDAVACSTVTCSQPTVITPTLCQTVTVTGSLAAGQVVWYSLNLPAVASPGYLDIDTEGTALVPTNDTEIGLYRATGALVTTDDNDGSGNLSQLSYGNTLNPRLPFGNSVAYNGRDGTLVAGQYYLAVAGFNSTFGTTNFNAASPSTFTGPYTVRVRLCDNVPTGACCKPDGTCVETFAQFACTQSNGGVYSGDGTTCATTTCTQPTVITLNPCQMTTVSGTLAAGQVNWYTLTIPAVASPAYLDIDTEGSAMVANDTEIGLYRSTGALVTTDDDDGSDLLSQLTYGNVSPRMAVGNGLAYNGRDGALVAGTYYLAVSGFNATFGTTAFNVVSPSTYTGPYQLRLTTCGDVPTGACCLSNGTCSAVTQNTCVVTNLGVYLGDGTTCGTPPCPDVGACCKLDGTCTEGFSTACVAASGGVFQGAGSTCASITCPQPNVFYSNCNIKTGTATLSGVGGLPAGSEWSECARDETDPVTANTTAGFTGNGAFRLADDFVVPAGGLTLKYVRAYAYLTGATVPNATAANIRIWNGAPNAGGVVVFGDTTTNRLIANTFAPIYRCFNTVAPITGCTPGGTAPDQTRHLQHLYIDVNQFLPAGTYWIDINYTGPSFSPPSVQADAIGRQCNPSNSNALQLNAGVWAQLADAGQGCVPTPVNQDLFFDVIGNVPVTCYPNCDHSTTQPCLNVLDFSCFLNSFANNETYANCDNSTIVPVLNVQDFSCFLNSFAAGCSSC